MISIFMKSLLIGYSGALMPGTLLAYTIDRSFKKGLSAGLLVPLGHLLLELPVVILLLTGFGKYLELREVRLVTAILGGLLLCYMGINMIAASLRNKLNVDSGKEDGRHGKNLVFNGFMLSATNPYFTIWWTVVGLGLITSAYNEYKIIGVIIFFIAHAICDLSWYLFVSFLICRSKRFINIKAYRIITAFLGLVLLFFSITFIRSGFKLLH